MPISALAKIIDENDARIKGFCHINIPESRSKEDHSQVKIVGVDETSCAKFHKYVSELANERLIWQRLNFLRNLMDGNLEPLRRIHSVSRMVFISK